MSRPKRIPPMDVIDEGIALTALINDYLIKNPHENREQMSVKFGIKGRGAIVYQHMKGVTPISMDAGIAYSKGIGVPLSAISKRLAIEASKRSDAIDGEYLSNMFNAEVGGLSDQEGNLIQIFRSLQSDDMRDIAIKQVSILVNKSPEVRGRAISNQKEKKFGGGK